MCPCFVRQKTFSYNSGVKPKYRRMLKKMEASEPKGERSWSVYILLCRGGSYYTGTAKDVEDRLTKHKAGKGAAYTRIHPPEKLLYREDGLTRSEALVREARIKALPHAGKEKLTQSY